MAELTTSITESVSINGTNRGNTNSQTISGIEHTFERVVTCIEGNVTTIAVFGTQPYSSDGALDVDRTKYIRITNLDAAAWIEVAMIGTATNYQVLLTPRSSHILCQSETISLAEADQDPSFGTMENLTKIQVKPVGSSYNPQVEIFAATT